MITHSSSARTDPSQSLHGQGRYPMPAGCAVLTGSCVFRVADEEKLERHELYESKRIAKAMLSYLARNHHLVGPLYDLLDIFTVHSRVDFSFLQTYFRETVAKIYSLENKRKVRTLCRRPKRKMRSHSAASL